MSFRTYEARAFRNFAVLSLFIRVFVSFIALLKTGEFAYSQVPAAMGDSVEVAPLAPAGEGRVVSGLLRFQWPLLLLLLVWLYHSILYNLALQWGKDPNFQHGWFVPAFSIYVLWQDRKRLKEIPANPNWAGMVLVVFGMAMLVVGQLGIELFTSRMSLLVVGAGLVILFRGWEFFKAVLFPLAFLVLMIPLPNLILQKVTFPLQLLASKLATGLLRLVEVPVLREGNMIILASKPLEVAEACSGIRSLLSLVTLSIIYGYLMEKRNWVRVVLACAAIPIAIFANSIRIFGTGLIVQYWNPDMAEGFYHEFQGWLLFVVSLILLFGTHRLINVIWKSAPRHGDGESNTGSRKGANQGGGETVSNGLARFMVVALVMAGTAGYLWAHAQDEVTPAREALSSLPAEINGWNSVNGTLDQLTLEILGNPEYILRDYVDPNGHAPWINLFVAYYATQKTGETPHTPAVCLPGAGWTPTQRAVIGLQEPGGHSFAANRYVISKGGERQLVIYWFEAQGREVASEYLLKYYLVRNSIRLHRSDGALIRLMTPMSAGETAEAAQGRVMQQTGNDVLRELPKYIPQ